MKESEERKKGYGDVDDLWREEREKPGHVWQSETKRSSELVQLSVSDSHGRRAHSTASRRRSRRPHGLAYLWRRVGEHSGFSSGGCCLDAIPMRVTRRRVFAPRIRHSVAEPSM